jgi:mannitol 2-dehydrogenase
LDELKTSSNVALSDRTLGQLPGSISAPGYDRSGLTAGIVHIGLGNFHRAHQAWYLHRLMRLGLAQDWAIIGAGIRAYDAAMREKLLAQDCLTTLIELDPDGEAVEVVGSMIDYLPIEEGNGALIARMADPAIRIVSMTVTEGGYYLDANGGFDVAHPDIAHDAAHAQAPRTVFGAIVAALKLRRDAGHMPFTALSCDNLQGNGEILRRCVLGLARQSDPALADWIDAHCTFPNSMVDCIVPATTPDVLAKVRALGIEDAAPVTHERFRQWVIEDRFCNGRPPLEQVGATLTDDVHSYEAMKLRILNAGHQLLANAGELLSVPTIADCMEDADIRAFFRKAQTDAIVPYVQPVPGMTPQAYLDLIERRFANPAIRDTTRRVAFDGSSRHPGFLLPSLRDALRAGGPIEGLVLAEALWARMCAGTREDGTTIDANDPHWDALQSAASAARAQPQVWLEQSRIYGSLSEDPRVSAAFATALSRIWTDGCRATIAAYLSS